jgi:hypothetical protein
VCDFGAPYDFYLLAPGMYLFVSWVTLAETVHRFDQIWSVRQRRVFLEESPSVFSLPNVLFST